MPSDTNYAPTLPAQVREAAARAEEMAREAGLAANPEENSPDGEATTVVDPSANGAGEQLDLPDIPQAPAAPSQAQPDWEQRYNTLQGKYNTEIPELRGQLRAMQDMITNLQTHPRAQEPPRPRETTFAPLPTRPVPDEDIESYGQDLVTATQRWSKIAVEPEIAELKQRIAQLEVGNQQTASMTTAQRCETSMDRIMPEWRQVNVDQGFINWLQQTDPFSGRTRQVLINEAYGAGDAPRTVAFFQAYANEHTTVSQTPGIQSAQTGDNPAGRMPLVDLAVPGRGPVSTPPTPGAPTRRIWTGADIATFYRQKQRGMWLGREQEAAQIEADFTAAAAEGRVRQ